MEAAKNNSKSSNTLKKGKFSLNIFEYINCCELNFFMFKMSSHNVYEFSKSRINFSIVIILKRFILKIKFEFLGFFLKKIISI